jgi:hypothetical protein
MTVLSAETRTAGTGPEPARPRRWLRRVAVAGVLAVFGVEFALGWPSLGFVIGVGWITWLAIRNVGRPVHR